MDSLVVASTVPTSAPDSVVDGVRHTIVQFFDAMNRQDLALMEEVTSHDEDAVHIGTDAGEIWRGWSHLHEDTIDQFERLESYEATIRNLSIHTNTTQTVAWYSHLLDADIRSGGGEAHWRGARFTGVLTKENSRWVLSQTHVSLPESHD